MGHQLLARSRLMILVEGRIEMSDRSERANVESL